MPKPGSKQTIAVDIDDVLASSAKGFIDYSNKKWGTSLSPDDYTEHWAIVWAVDEQEAEKRAKHIHANISKIVGSYSHNNDAKPVLAELSKKYNLVIVTSRRKSIQKDTLEWLDIHFKGLFKEVHFAGIWDDLDKDLKIRIKSTKTEVLEQIGANFLVDDQPKHCIAAAEAGIKTILFGDYRWNRDIEPQPNIARAKTWQEVLEYFNAEG